MYGIVGGGCTGIIGCGESDETIERVEGNEVDADAGATAGIGMLAGKLGREGGPTDGGGGGARGVIGVNVNGRGLATRAAVLFGTFV